MSPPPVSVVVVTHESASTIGECLASIRAEAHRLPIETVVVDNASRDDTLARVSADFPEARVLALDDNRGFAAGSNAGAAIAAGEALFFLNPDAAIRPLALVELTAALQGDPGLGVVGPRIVASDGEAELSFGGGVDFAGEAVQRALGALRHRRLPGVSRWLAWRSRRPHWPAWVSGAAILIPRRLYRELGGMDEGFFLYLEDVDLCYRARAAGRGVLYWPKAEVFHRRGVSARSDPARARREYRRSQLRFYRKHHGEEAAALLRLYLGSSAPEASCYDSAEAPAANLPHGQDRDRRTQDP